MKVRLLKTRSLESRGLESNPLESDLLETSPLESRILESRILESRILESRILEDEKIVELYLNRKEEAVQYTSEKYGSSLRKTSFRITGDMQTSEECENDTYLEAWNRIPPHEPRTYLLPFLLRIVRNLSMNRCIERTRLKRSAFLLELSEEMEQCIPAPDNVENHLDGEILGSIISAFLRGLPKEKRLMFLQRYFFLDSISSIAKRFGFSESKVKTTLFRIRKELREYLIKEGYTV